MANTDNNCYLDMDKIFSSAGRVVDTSRNVYDALKGFNSTEGSRRNLGANQYGQTPQQSYPSYGYGYYDDQFSPFNGMMNNGPMMNNQTSDYYPGISSPVYGKGGC